MNISDRYRELTDELRHLAALSASELPAGEEKAQQLIARSAGGMAELEELVGEIPRIQLEAKLTPVLMKSHGQLDRARLLLEELGAEDRAAAVWELEQKIYRLLNAL